MAEIEELEGRILAALDRIGAGVARLPDPDTLADALTPPAPVAPEPEPVEDHSARVAELEAALEDERLVTAQLEERVKALRDRKDDTIRKLRDEIEEMRAQAARGQEASERLRQANADLRDLTAQLREQLSRGVAEPHLINKAMMAELEALRASRAADIAEVEALVAELRPLIAEEAE